MKTLLAVLAAAALVAAAVTAGAPAASADPAPTPCGPCHGEQATSHRKGVHAEVLSCADCHGGDPAAIHDKEKAHAKEKGFTGKVARERIPLLCGECHADPVRTAPYGLATDQLAHYRTSFHGKALFGKGDTEVAVCTDCHGTHGILDPKDPAAPTSPTRQPETCGKCHADKAKMAKHGLSSDVVERFRTSVHGIALLDERARGAPSCSDCHGSHGAVPPGVTDVPQVCGHCHTNTEEQYRKSPHHAKGDQFSCRTCHDKPTETSIDYRRGGCTACHDTHAIAKPDATMYEGDAVGRCGHCHRQADAKVDAVKSVILEGTADLRRRVDHTRGRLLEAKEKGLFLKDEDEFLRESERALVSVWPLSHSLDGAALSKHLTDGVQRQDRADESLDREFTKVRDRKIVMGAVVLVLLLLAALFAVKLETARRLS